MIFVTVGSQKFQFDRLLKAIDEAIAQGDIAEEVFAQTGYCRYTPQRYSYKDFLDRDEFTTKMNQADIVITHGGTGAIIGAVKQGKKVIAVPRLAKYGEHVDDHQLQLIEQFSEMKLICACFDCDTLKDAIEEANNTNYLSYSSNTYNLLDSLTQFIETISN